MVFSSLVFLYLFLPCLLACYYLTPNKFRGLRNGILLAFSLVFYTYGGPRFLILMLVSIALNYMGGRLCAPQIAHRKVWMWCAVAGNLALLGWFKYAMFVGGMLQSVLPDLVVPEVVLPIGISFFTFQGLSYVLDVYKGQAQVEKNPLAVALYVALFPQLVAGPIVRYTTVSHEIGHRRETLDDFTAGAIRFLLGLGKKMILANALGELADLVFATATVNVTTTYAWLGALAYTGQIYFDFSAYSDMAIGLGRMFGFHFLENFNYPYVSQSVTEFWRRWHMSLSSWFRDYVYIPLGGNRGGVKRHLRNLFIVWALTGIWHGAAWTFMAWGLYFGVLLAGEKYVWGEKIASFPRPVRHLYALVLVVVSWVFFRSETFAQAGELLRAMAGFADAGFTNERTDYYLRMYGWALLLAIPAALPVKGWIEGWLTARQHKALWRQTLLWGPMVLAGLVYVYSFLLLSGASFNPFLYFRF